MEKDKSRRKKGDKKEMKKGEKMETDEWISDRHEWRRVDSTG